MRLRSAPLAVLGGGMALTAALVAWSIRPRRVEVVGESMLPTLVPGDRLLVLRLPPAVGAVVALADPRGPGRLLLKRLAAGPGGEVRLPEGGRLVAGDGYLVLGDNPAASTDSVQFGAVPAGLLRGRAVYRYAPPERRGALPTAPTPWRPSMAISSPLRP